MKWLSETVVVVAAALAPAAADAVSLEGLSWSLTKGAAISGSTLTAEIAQAGGPQCAAKAAVDLSGMLGDGLGLVFTVRVKATGVTKPDRPWNGVKFMVSYKDADTGKMHHPGAAVPIGTYGWKVVTNRVNVLTAPVNPADGKATICLGLQGCTGRVEFDLGSLSVYTEDVGVRPVNQGYVVKYPGSAGKARRRGCMLPARDTTEKDIADLAEWGATLGRFQIERNWSAENGNQDLAEYAAWVDSRLDNLADVLRWAKARGMKIVVDLHSPPGGKRNVDGVRTMNMFFEEKYADAFVETWKRIATRFRGNDAVYGYDLVNEPEHRVPVPFSYWELQRRAAEAVREIDRWLEKLGMSEYRNKRLDTLSKGNQQKIQLITALVHDPDIVILDEPFSGLDPVNAQLLKDVVREQIARDKIVLFSSHQMNYIEEFCNRIAILNQGKIVLQGELREIKHDYPRDRLVLRSEQPEALRAAFGAACQTMDDGALLLRLRAPEEKKAVMRRLAEDFELDEVRVFEPSLNDIFVEYAGDAGEEEQA